MCKSQTLYSLTKKTNFNAANELTGYTEYHFEKGRKVRKEYYDNSKKKSYITFEYNDDYLVEKESYFYSDDRLSLYRVNEYDNEKRLISILHYSNTHKLTSLDKYTYNSENKISKLTIYDNDDKLPSSYITFKYNSAGKILEEKSFSWPLKYQSKIIYKYDENDRLIEKSEEAAKSVRDGKSSSSYEYENGLMISSLTCGSGYCDGFRYEYDQAGNLIKETHFDLYYVEEQPEEIMGNYTIYEYKENKNR